MEARARGVRGTWSGKAQQCCSVPPDRPVCGLLLAAVYENSVQVRSCAVACHPTIATYAAAPLHAWLTFAPAQPSVTPGSPWPCG